MASLMALFDKLSLSTHKKYDTVRLYQKQYNAIFVNLCEDDKTVIAPGIERKNYYNRDSFLKTFGIDFDTEIEAKAKDLAVIKYRKQFQLIKG